ncbi:hypothetical protein [uncultured Cellulomonas sp.]|uniref:hypothetical protein n=1 Tax=uncultured Cellulomonas sp. TaxID=189682 RepID=UPI0028E54B9B|nr:hypothetical protein [uncultured Cellulomonas sp.]
MTALPASAVVLGEIESPGPLERIAVSADLNCDVRYVGDTSPEFYAGIACGTFVAVGGELYGPANVPAGGGASPRTSFTTLSQVGPVGAGTVADPFRVTTSVELGSSGIRLTEVDSYVAGKQSYTTRITLVNGSGSDTEAIVYRAGDCYVENSDNGYGAVDEGAVSCVSQSGRVAKWIPVTGGSAFYEAGYNEVWAGIGAQTMFPNTVRATEFIDNGAGLSWSVPLPDSESADVVHLTAFSDDETEDDADGDGLLDEWERSGIDVDGDGSPEVDLPAMGASPDHKDLFVEADWMARDRSCFLWWCSGGESFAPQQGAIDDVVASMGRASVDNPDGTTGIRLHVDAGPDSIMNPVTGTTWGSRSRAGSVGLVESLGSNGASGYDWSAFNDLKADHFEPARADAFHYAIFADTYAGSGSSGIAQVSNDPWEGDSFLVTDGDPSWGGGFSRRQEAGTLMHEFGHTLGLRHGGGDHVNFKPNYLSIMSYQWQMGRRTLDYSRSQLLALDEAALDETVGMPGAVGRYAWTCATGGNQEAFGAVETDWNCDGVIAEEPVSSSIDPDPALDLLTGYDDWENLVYDGGAVGAFGIGDLRDQDPPLQFTDLYEPTYDELRAIDAVAAPGDGTLAVHGPYVLLPGVVGQALRLDVTNVGAVAAPYAVATTGVAGLPARTDVDAVPAYSTASVEVPVDGSRLLPGSYRLTVRLSPAAAEDDLATTVVDVLVPDLTDPAVLAEAEQIRAAFATPQPGIDEVDRLAALQSLGAALHVPATVTVRSGDGQSAAAGTAFDAPSVLVLDATGMPVVNEQVQFAVTSGSASFATGATSTVVTDADGVAVSGALTAGAVPGTVQVTATARAVSAALTLQVTAAQASPAEVAVRIQAPASAARGVTFPVRVTVTNSGGTAATNAVTRVTIPRSADVVGPLGARATGANWVITTGSLAAGQSVTYTFQVTKGSNGTLPIQATFSHLLAGETIEASDSVQVEK